MAAWLSADWASRMPLAVNNWGGDNAGVDVTLTIPPSFERFWSTVKSNGYDVRFCGPDGTAARAFKRTSWDYATKTAVLELDAVPSKAGTLVLWLYWGNANAVDGATSPTISTPKTASLFFGVPAGPLIVARPEAPTATSARTLVAKASAEELLVWWDFRSRLMSARIPSAGSRGLEGIAFVTAIDAQNTSEASQAGMLDNGKTVVLGGVVGTWLKAGTSASAYSLICRVETSLGRVLEARGRLQVRNMEV